MFIRPASFSNILALNQNSYNVQARKSLSNIKSIVQEFPKKNHQQKTITLKNKQFNLYQTPKQSSKQNNYSRSSLILPKYNQYKCEDQKNSLKCFNQYLENFDKPKLSKSIQYISQQKYSFASAKSFKYKKQQKLDLFKDSKKGRSNTVSESKLYDLNQCTFKPKITKRSQFLTKQRIGKNVFQTLYNFQKKVEIKYRGSTNRLSVYKKQIKLTNFYKQTNKNKQLKSKQVNITSIKSPKKFKHSVNIKQKTEYDDNIQVYRIYRKNANNNQKLETQADQNLKQYIEQTLHKVQNRISSNQTICYIV